MSKKGKYTYLGYTASENTAVTLSEPITNFEEIVVYSRYQGYTLGMLRRPADHFNDGKESIISFNDGTIRKAQFTLVKNTVVAKYLTEVSDITIYGISRINY